MSYKDPPKREGYKLKYDYECEYSNWLDLGGCTCPFSSPPCSSCTHEGHPISLEENDEAWELDIEEEEMSRQDIVKKVIEPKVGDKVQVLDQQQLNEMSPYCTLTLNKSYEVIKVHPEAKTIKIVDDNGRVITWHWGRFKKSEASPIIDVWNDWSSKKDDLADSLPFIFQKEVLLKGTTSVNMVKPRGDSVNKPSVRHDDAVDAYGVGILKHFCKKDIELTIKLNKQEETTMSQIKRRVLNIQLLDNDAGLPVEHSLVAEFDGVVTEDTDEVTIQELISTGEVAKHIEAHNKVRIEQDNLEIQNRTGNTVKLRPIKLKNLTWNIK